MIHYYSFYLGKQGSPRSQWLFEDCKLPAADPKSAIMLHYFLESYIRRKKAHWMSNKDVYTFPAQILIDYKYRGLIEWVKVERKSYGKTLVQFKKIKFYTQHSLIY
jgi:hypothetical protein